LTIGLVLLILHRIGLDQETNAELGIEVKMTG